MRFFSAIPSGSVILASTTLASYILGLLRDRTFAHTFGASRELDAYNAAFILPDFLFNMLVASGIAAAFVPIFTGLFRSNRRAAEDYTNTILTAAVTAMCISGLALFVFAGPAAKLVAPGFTDHEQSLAAQLLRILALSPIIFAASNALGAMLVARQRFLAYGLSPVFYNAGIIAGTIFLAPLFGVMGVAIGTVIGAALHLGTRVFAVIKLKHRFSLHWTFHTTEFRQTLRLMLPKMIGHPLELATFWGFTAIASGLAAGSIAVLNFARNFQSVPVSVIGIAAATAAFPLLARAAAEQSTERFRAILVSSFWLIFLVSSLAAIVTYLIREPLVSTILGGRAFGPEAVARTATTLGVFTLAIPTEALSQLLARAYYATKNTLLPVTFSVIGFAIAVNLAWFLTPHVDLLALPLAFALGSAVKLVLLILFISSHISKIALDNHEHDAENNRRPSREEGAP